LPALGNTFFVAHYPDRPDEVSPDRWALHAGLTFGADVAGGGTHGALPSPFYVWASVIQDGRVVATDYAPDVGWLAPSPDAKP
jgi:hypothetical protein